MTARISDLHIARGQRGIARGSQGLVYGQSVTDGCIGWDSTVAVLGELADAVRTRRAAA